MEEVEIWEKDFNNEVNNKSNQIGKEVEGDNVLTSETKQANNGDANDRGENDGDDYEKKGKYHNWS